MMSNYGPEWDKLEKVYNQANEKSSEYLTLAKKYNAMASKQIDIMRAAYEKQKKIEAEAEEARSCDG